MTAARAVEGTRSAVLDEAHLGDVHGALGHLSERERLPRRRARARLAALAAVSGPGMLALLADNDAGGIATYAQAGQDQGTRLLWVLVLLFPVLVVNQEMAARLGAVSGVGHARLIFARFGRLWGSFALGDLLVLNALTLLTEMIGVRLAASLLGVSPRVAVVGSTLVLLAALATGSFRTWERVMYALMAVDVALIPLVVLSHAQLPLRDMGVPGFGSSSAGGNTVLLVIALAGTTVAPWQLFFQQATVVDKRITPRWLQYERVETVTGAVLMVAGAIAIVVVVAAAAAGTGAAGHFTDAGAVAHLLGARLGGAAQTLFAVVLLDGALLGAAAITLSTAYATSEVAGFRHSLHRTPDEAPAFYGVLAAMLAGAAGVALLPGVPLGLVTLLVQVLAGVLLPGATVFLLLLANDTQVLGPWVNGPWLNRIAATVVAALLLLSALLVVSTLFPHLWLGSIAPALTGLTAVVLLVVGASMRWGRQPWRDLEVDSQPGADRLPLHLVPSSRVVVLGRLRRSVDTPRQRRRRAWRMPPLDELKRPIMSRGRIVSLVTLRAYLLVAVLTLAVRGILLATGR